MTLVQILKQSMVSLIFFHIADKMQQKAAIY